MEKIKKLFLRKCNAVLVALLGVFGFSGCNCNNIYYPMYASPITDFVVKGVVENIENSKPIEDIQVKLIKHSFIDMNGKEHIVYRATKTDEDGSFKLYGSFTFLPKNSEVRFIDENGVFAEKTKKFDWEDAEQTRPGSGFWFDGEFTKTLPTVQLTPKTDEDYEEENEETN